MNLVDEQDGAALVAQFRQHALETLLKISSILGTSQQRAQVQRVYGDAGEDIRHLPANDPARQALGHGRLADPGLADEQRVVLAPPAEHLDGALDLRFPADERVDQALLGALVEVGRELVERARLGRSRACLLGRLRLIFLTGLQIQSRDAVGNEVHHIQPGDVVLVEQVGGVGILFAEDRDQHIGALDFLLAGRLHVVERPLQHALEADGRLGITPVIIIQQRHGLLHHLPQITGQCVEVGFAGAQHAQGRRIFEQRQQQVLDGQEFVTPPACLLVGLADGDLEFLAEHGPVTD